MSKPKMRLAVFASGNGSNAQAIYDAIEAGTLDAEFTVCVTNNRDAGVVDRFGKLGVPIAIIDPNFTASILYVLEQHNVNFIALAGYLRKIPSELVKMYSGRMLNIHPALLPSFGGKGMYGRRVHQAVLDYGVKYSGATVHLVDTEYDTGGIVFQETVPVFDDDSAEDLAERVLEIEHMIYPLALSFFADGLVKIDGRRVIVVMD